MSELQSQYSVWLPPLLAAFFASGLTAWFSLLRFRKERWWEKKFEAYVTIIEALHNMSLLSDEELEASGTGRKVSEERQQELLAKYRTGEGELYRQIEISEFLLAKETPEALRALLREMDNARAETDFVAHHDRCSNAVQSCIAQIRTLARRDLHPPFWRRFRG